MQKLLTFFQQKICLIMSYFNGQGFKDKLIDNMVSFEQLGPDVVGTN